MMLNNLRYYIWKTKNRNAYSVKPDTKMNYILKLIDGFCSAAQHK